MKTIETETATAVVSTKTTRRRSALKCDVASKKSKFSNQNKVQIPKVSPDI